MPFRYRIIGFGAAEVADPKSLLAAIGGSPLPATRLFGQWKELVEHLGAIGTTTLLVQDGVRDPDFLQEHEAFYSKQHRTISRHCVRIHAFRQPLPAVGPTADRTEVLAFIDAAARNDGCYLGFTTVRPLRHAPVGATIVAPLDAKPTLCRDIFPVHIAGTAFEVTGTPYLQQDNAVGACAQASIWMALRTIRKRSGNSAYSPAELTLSATRYLTLDRVFPGRKGLTIQQMVAAITATDHDPLVIQLAEPPNRANADHVISQALPYLDSGLPVILGLMHPTSGGHAVVAIGVDAAHQNFLPISLVIHNDNRGPYRLLPKATQQGSDEYALDQAFTLIVPLPQGVFMSAAEAVPQAISHLDFWLTAFMSAPLAPNAVSPVVPMVLRTYLCPRHTFRRWAKDCVALDPIAADVYRTAEMPKLVWVVEIHDAASFTPASASHPSRLGEVVLDAAADAEHGDALVFIRIASQMLTVPTQSPGMLIVQEAITTTVALTRSIPCAGLTQQWDQ